jgi:hypothetical protein
VRQYRSKKNADPGNAKTRLIRPDRSRRGSLLAPTCGSMWGIAKSPAQLGQVPAHGATTAFSGAPTSIQRATAGGLSRTKGESKRLWGAARFRSQEEAEESHRNLSAHEPPPQMVQRKKERKIHNAQRPSARCLPRLGDCAREKCGNAGKRKQTSECAVIQELTACGPQHGSLPGETVPNASC